MNILTVTYTGESDDIFEQAVKDTFRNFGFIHIQTFLRVIDLTWEMEFRKIERQRGDNGRN